MTDISVRLSAFLLPICSAISLMAQQPASADSVVDKDKPKEERLRGYSIHPELYGAPAEKQIEWARHPELMKRMQERPLAHPSARLAQANNMQPSK
jgi:hypothetical protein